MHNYYTFGLASEWLVGGGEGGINTIFIVVLIHYNA